MNFWRKKSLRNLIATTEANIIQPALEDCYGRYLLYFSADQQPPPATRGFQYIIDGYQDVSCRLEELPFATDSIGCVVIQHALERSAYPEKVLEEIYRVLVPNGRVVIVGFNRYSLWGVIDLCMRSKRTGKLRKWYGQFRVSRYLMSAGLTILTKQTALFRPPVTAPNMQQKLLFLEGVGQFIAPLNGGVYAIVATKLVHGLTPLRKESHEHKKILAGTTVRGVG